MMLRFADPWMLLILLPVALAGWWLWRRGGRPLRPRMRYSSSALLEGAPVTLRARLLGVPAVALLLAAALLAVAMARPQSAWSERRRFTEGIDIMLVLDVSDSMRALDFQPNRLLKAKEVVKQFIGGRTDDQIGVVIFARETFTLCPLTHDYQALQEFVDRIDFDLVPGDSTAIGMGLANAVDKLKDSKARSKVAILLTDGENNAGRISPVTAAQIAQKLGVRVYTIGVGPPGGEVRVPRMSPLGMTIDFAPSMLDVKELTTMAQMTGGQFFLATDGESLEKIYGQIDRMERTKIELSDLQYFDELGQWLVIPALLLLLGALLLETTWLRTFP